MSGKGDEIEGRIEDGAVTMQNIVKCIKFQSVEEAIKRTSGVQATSIEL